MNDARLTHEILSGYHVATPGERKIVNGGQACCPGGNRARGAVLVDRYGNESALSGVAHPHSAIMYLNAVRSERGTPCTLQLRSLRPERHRASHAGAQRYLPYCAVRGIGDIQGAPALIDRKTVESCHVR